MNLPSERFPAGALIESVPGFGDSDRDTALTVEAMCGYILAGASDSEVQRWAAESMRFEPKNAGVPADESIAWAVWWFVKHRVRFVSDEPRLLRMRLGRSLDLLVAPSVLVRMNDPREDCDGFTMLILAMLKAIGLRESDLFICTVAAEPSNPGRWSHVFPVLRMGSGECVALDASHGAYPGWLVPAAHTFRSQMYSLDGRPVPLQPSHGRSKLQGYRRRSRRGVGDLDFIDADWDAWLGGGGGGGWSIDNIFLGPGSGGSGGGGGGSAGGGFNWNQLLNNLVGQGAKVASLAVAPSTTYRLPNGTVVTQPYGLAPAGGLNPLALQTGSFTSLLPWIAVGGVALLLIGRGK